MDQRRKQEEDMVRKGDEKLVHAGFVSSVVFVLMLFLSDLSGPFTNIEFPLVGALTFILSFLCHLNKIISELINDSQEIAE